MDIVKHLCCLHYIHVKLSVSQMSRSKKIHQRPFPPTHACMKTDFKVQTHTLITIAAGKTPGDNS